MRESNLSIVTFIIQGNRHLTEKCVILKEQIHDGHYLLDQHTNYCLKMKEFGRIVIKKLSKLSSEGEVSQT